MLNPYKVRLTEDHIAVQTPYSDVALCRAVPLGRYSSEWKCWLWPRGPGVARALVDAFGSKLTKADGADQLLALVEAPAIPPGPPVIDPGHIPGLKTTPWKHQREAYGLASSLPGAMLAMGMGCGKTLTAIALLSSSPISLILCPKAVISVWPMEFAKHASVQPNIVLLNKGTGEAKARIVADLHRAALARRAGNTVVILNYEDAWREPLAEALLKMAWNTVILDEIHKIKAASGKASKFCARLRRVAERMVGLTGTPMPHSPVDLYAQYRALDPRVFGTNVHSFKQHYTISGGFGGHQVIGYQHQDEMRAKFMSIAYQADRSVIELPDATHTVIPVELGPKAMKTYKGLANDLHAAIEGGECTAANALVKLLRLQQLTGGYLKLDDVDRLVEMDTGKREALAELLESIGTEPVVVFCRFRSDMDAVHLECKALGLASCELSGRQNDLAAWQKGEGQVIAVQIQSGGVGVDLTRASYCVYYSLGFSLGDYDQSLARVHRPGQKNAVSYYHLIVEGTVDRQVYDALDARRDVVNTILEGIKSKEHA